MATLVRFGGESPVLTTVLAKRFTRAIFQTVQTLIRTKRLKWSYLNSIHMLITFSGGEEDFSLPRIAELTDMSLRTLQRRIPQWVTSGILEPTGPHRYRVTDEVYLPNDQQVQEYMAKRDAFRRHRYGHLPQLAQETARRMKPRATRTSPWQTRRGNRQVVWLHARRRSVRKFRPCDLGRGLS
ncbi:MAG: hypothetical protein IPL96_00015 [Holophagaceae bacterium]|nr:hypothetical protein [Holophagaceae bacterium]